MSKHEQTGELNGVLNELRNTEDYKEAFEVLQTYNDGESNSFDDETLRCAAVEYLNEGHASDPGKFLEKTEEELGFSLFQNATTSDSTKSGGKQEEFYESLSHGHQVRERLNDSAVDRTSNEEIGDGKDMSGNPFSTTYLY